MKKINSIILKLRLNKGLTQANMASHLKVSQKSYSYLESGKTLLKVSHLMLIIKILEMEPAVFFKQVFKMECHHDCEQLKNNNEQTANIKNLELKIIKLEKTISVLELTIENLLKKEQNA